MRSLLRVLALLLSVSLVAAACGDDDPVEESSTSESESASASSSEMADEGDMAEEAGTIVDVAVGAGTFETLVAAVTEAGLVETLSGEGPFTVFAPTDDAFAAALDALGLTADELLASDALGEILTYHVLAGEVDAETAISLDGQSAETVQGEEINISVVDGSVMINDATVISPDVEASNGIIHVIDAVILPPSVADALLGDDMAEDDMAEEAGTIVDVAVAAGFETLVAAVTEAGLVETLSGEGPFTVFAPTDEAFAAALDALGITAEDLLANPALADILTYHVVAGEVDAETAISLDGQTAATVQGEEIAISVVDGSVVINDATVIQADVQASNGIIHVIDAVILPPTIAEALGLGGDAGDDEAAAELGTIVGVADEAGIFTTLLAAGDATGLSAALDAPGDFTVFAPTDDAFAAALDALGLTAEELLADTATLTSILTYHALLGSVDAETAISLDGQSVATVGGAEIDISVVDGSVVINGVATVIQADVQASNGVIHVIDAVLLPPA